VDIGVDDADRSDGELNLPLESARRTPETDDPSEIVSNPPVYLLNQVGSKLQESTASFPSTRSSELRHFGEGLVVSTVPQIVPGVPDWTRDQLKVAAERKRHYFRYGNDAVKRDISASLDPVTRGLVSEQKAEELIVRYVCQVNNADRKILHCTATSNRLHGSPTPHPALHARSFGPPFYRRLGCRIPNRFRFA
jgi:hypothetical protein